MRRHTRSNPCQACGGYDGMPHSRGVRCAGFDSDDSEWCHCTREEHAGPLELNDRTQPPTYAHRLHGECRCGRSHGAETHPVPQRASTGTARDTHYDYHDADGRPVVRVTRRDRRDGSKSYPQARWDGERWVWGISSQPTPLYRLPEQLAADPGELVLVAEGEKCADRLAELGYVATTNAGGAGKWTDAHSEQLRGRHVALLADNDDPGRRHVRKAAVSLHGKAASIRIVEFPDLPEKGDVADWLNAGHTPDELRALINETAPWEPAATGPRFLSMRELAELPDEPTEWLVDGLLPHSGTSLMNAKPKAGKSVLAQNLAVCVAQGTPFLGRATTAGPVLYLALEEKQAEVKRHMLALGAGLDDDLYFYVAAAPDDGMAWLCNAATKYAPVLIIVDTWHRFTRVRDINDYAAVNLAMEPLTTLARQSGAHLLFTHHANKGLGGDAGDAVLGSTALYGAVDTLVSMKRTGERRTVLSIQRYGDDLPESVAEMDPNTFRVTLCGTRQEVDERDVAGDILAFLQETGTPETREKIEDNTEGQTGVIRAALKRLQADGQVTRTGEGRRNAPYHYQPAGVSCSLVPIYIREQENKKPEMPHFPQNDANDACSRVDGQVGPGVASREQANMPPVEAQNGHALAGAEGLFGKPHIVKTEDLQEGDRCRGCGQILDILESGERFCDTCGHMVSHA